MELVRNFEKYANFHEKNISEHNMSIDAQTVNFS